MRKSPGVDNIKAEILKYMRRRGGKLLHVIIETAWETNEYLKTGEHMLTYIRKVSEKYQRKDSGKSQKPIYMKHKVYLDKDTVCRALY